MGTFKDEFLVYDKFAKVSVEALPVGDDVPIFLVQKSDVALSTRMSELEWVGNSMPGSMIASRTALHENMIVAHSMLLIVIR